MSSVNMGNFWYSKSFVVQPFCRCIVIFRLVTKKGYLLMLYHFGM